MAAVSPAAQAPAPTAGVTVATAAATQSDGRPSEAELGFPVYPSAVYLQSYDAGRGQKSYTSSGRRSRSPRWSSTTATC